MVLFIACLTNCPVLMLKGTVCDWAREREMYFFTKLGEKLMFVFMLKQANMETRPLGANVQ